MKENLAGQTWNQLIVNKFSFTAGYCALFGLYRYNALLRPNTPYSGSVLYHVIGSIDFAISKSDSY